MARNRPGTCNLCGDHVPYPYKGNKCQACKAPAVRTARKALRKIYRDDRDERVIEDAA